MSAARRKRLETVLRVRRIQEDLRQAELAAAALAVRAREADHERSAELYASRSPLARADAATFVGQARRSLALADRLADAAAHHAAALEQQAQARQELTAAAVRSAGLQRLVDRARGRHRDAQMTSDQRVAEESATARKAGRR